MKKIIVLKFTTHEKKELVVSRNWEYEIIPVGTKFSIWEISGEVISLEYREEDDSILYIIVHITRPISNNEFNYMVIKMRGYGFE